MNLSVNFSFILMVALVLLSRESDAAPAAKHAGPITMKIRSVHGHNRRDLHPQLYLQQQINRATRRLARMTGRTAPTDADLRARLDKRITLIGDAPLSRKNTIIKRYNPANQMIDAFQAKAKSGGLQAQVSSGNVQGAIATASKPDDTSAGVSPLDIQAALNGGLTSPTAPTSANSIGLSIEGPDAGYVAEVQLGTPPRNFRILMDSGSADFWVGSEHCQSEAGGGCGNHTFLGSQSSSTFVDTGKPFNVTYGTGNVAGTIIQDNVNLAGLKLLNHTFGTADLESVDFSSDSVSFDGLMGLAQSGLSQQGVATPVESLAAAGSIPAAITSYKIARLADQKNDGEITFGALDNTKFDQNTLVTFPNVNAQGFWEGNMAAVSVNGQDTGLQGRTAILDTGTTLVIAPPQDALAVHQLIPGAASDGQGGFIVPCTTNASVALTFGGQSFAIDSRDLATLPLNPQDPTGNCTSGISSGAVGGGDEWLVGDVFLKNAYFSTDVTNNEISLAKFV